MKRLLFTIPLLLVFMGSVSATSCNSCSDCTTKISSGSAVELSQNISSTGDCLDVAGSDNGNVIDCQGYSIIGDGSGDGITINSYSDNNIIKNCDISNYTNGIYAIGDGITNTIIRDSSIRNIPFGTGLQLGSTLIEPQQVINVTFINIGYGNTLANGDIEVANCSFISSATVSNQQCLKLGNDNEIHDNYFEGCKYAIGGIGSKSGVDLYNNIFNDSGQGDIRFTGDLTNSYIYNNKFNHSSYYLSISGTVTNVGLNTSYQVGTNIIGGSYIGGNFYPDYVGFDNEGDGIGETSFSLEGLTDYLPLTNNVIPLMDFSPSTPDNGTTQLDIEYIFINVTNPYLDYDTCILEWNGVNESMITSGQMCYLNKTDLTPNDFTFTVYGNATGYFILNLTETRTVTIEFSPPNISIESPTGNYHIVVGQSTYDVPIDYSVSGLVIDSCWYNIGSGNVSLPSCDNTTVGLEADTYTLTLYANNTLGLESSESVSFSVLEPPLNNIPAPFGGVAAVAVAAGFILLMVGLYLESGMNVNFFITGTIGLIIVIALIGYLLTGS